MLDPVLAAVEGRDVTVVYLTSVRPLESASLQAAVGDATDIVVVEPTLAATSLAALGAVMGDRALRIQGLGVTAVDLHRFGDVADHDRAQGLDPAGLRRSIDCHLRL